LGNDSSTTCLGVGITYSDSVRPLLESRPELFQVVEVEPQTTWLKLRNATPSYRVDEEVIDRIVATPGRKLVHSIGTPVGGTVRPDAEQLVLLRSTIEILQSPWASDHLSFNQTPEFATGFFLPPRQTSEGVRTAVRSIADLQDALAVPVAVETGVNYLRPRADEMADGEFVAEVVEEADCGLLLDLHNVFANALNGRQRLDDYIDQLPLERIWEIHLAGGMELDGFWLDAHSGAIPDPLYGFAEKLIPNLPNLGAIIFEIFPSFVPVVGLDLVRDQMLRLHELWEKRQPSTERKRTLQSRISPIVYDGAPPAVWERALGGLVVGRPAEGDLAADLSGEPAIRVIQGLVFEFRASMIVGALRMTSRFLMLSLGPKAFRIILNDYCAKTTPQMYAGLEAEEFGAYLRALDLNVPHLAKVVEFELAAMASVVDDKTRVIHFDFEPIPLLRALAESRLPEVIGEAGDYEIAIASDGPIESSGLNLGEVRGAFPFH